MSEPANRELFDALNLICKYGMEHLAEGWEISISISSDECSIELLNPEGEEEHVDVDYLQSTLRAMCDLSHTEHEDA